MFKLIFILLLIFLTVIAAVNYYEMKYFKPYLPRIEESYNQAKKQETVTEMLKNIIWCLETPFDDENDPDAHVAGIVARHFVYEFLKYEKTTEWHFHNILWARLLIHYFDREKLFLLYLHYMPFEHGQGLANSAQYYFQKNISQLTVEEVIVLLGVARSPNRYSPFSNPEEANRIKGILIQKLKESKCFLFFQR